MGDDPRLQKSFEERLGRSKAQRMDLLRHIGRRDWMRIAPIEQASRRLEQKGLFREARRMAKLLDRVATGFEEPLDEEVDALNERVFEALVGDSQIMSANFLERGTRASRTVGRLVSMPGRAPNGSGFLISPNLLLTNAHVVANEADAARYLVQLDYVAAGDGSTITPVEFRLQPGSFFLGSPPDRLDFALVAVEPRNAGGAELTAFGWSPLNPQAQEVERGDRVNIIHHPSGSPKRVSLRQNFVVATDVEDAFVHYMTDTQRGSSGSPVFDDQWSVVALHHAARSIEDEEEAELYRKALRQFSTEAPRPDQPVVVNEGASVSSLVDHLHDRSPALDPERRRLLEKALEGAAPDSSIEIASRLRGSTSLASLSGSGARLEIPLEVTFSLNGVPVGPAARTSAAGDSRGPLGPARFELFRNEPEAEKSVLQGLQSLQSARESEYLPPTDVVAQRRQEYYGSIIGDVANDDLDPAQLYRALADLLKDTLEIADAFPEPLAGFESLLSDLELEALELEGISYDRARAHLYTSVDLQADRMLRCVYTNTVIAPEQLLLRDVLTGLGHKADLPRRFRNNQYLNCEHIVPQSWFARETSGVSDLHHLITADGAANNFRSDCRYREVNGTGRLGPTNRPSYIPEAGRKVDATDDFEPARSKPVVARATLYFLMAHEGKIDATKYGPADIAMLRSWAKQADPSAYEHHRNEAIFEVQGNRNPLIDFPEWADRIDFGLGVA